jgi:hypothetical protein
MKKKKIEAAESRMIRDHEVFVEIFHDKFGYYGFWACPSLSNIGGGSNTHWKTVRQAIDMAFVNAAGGVNGHLPDLPAATE